MNQTTPDEHAPGRMSDAVVRKVAHLSRLAIDDEAVPAFASRLGSILQYVERLQSLDLEDIEPLSNPLDATNRVDEDEPRAGLPTETLMKMAPQSTPPFVTVPKVLGDGEGA